MTFNGTSAGTATSWSANSITVNVPSGLFAGNTVVVTVAGVASNGVGFYVAPVITSLSTTSGAAGTPVTITGRNFAFLEFPQQYSNTVKFNGISAGTATSWSANSITVNVPSGATTGNVVVTIFGVASNGVNFTVLPPSITSVSPTSGAAGVQVTLSGSGFGSTRGTGSVWLGSTPGTVVSWNNTQIVATVASNATSGTAQVQQGGLWSNAVTFSVSTPTISNVTPASGGPGTPVTITGSGFGAVQGNGLVWLGTAYGVVQSWSNTQVIALVANGATFGNSPAEEPAFAASPQNRGARLDAVPAPRAQSGSPDTGGSPSSSVRIIQNGVSSNSVSFTVNTLHIASVSPTAGTVGTSVTVTGTAFGSSQGSGTILLGSTNGQVTSWSDSQVVATVVLGSLTGVVRIQQNGVWSNGIGFTIGSGGNTLVPNMLNMVVGDTRTLQALSAAGQPVTGLAWTSSDTSIVSLSTDDPPLLTALAPGHVTIKAGTAATDVIVSAGTLPTGTVIWSNPGNGSNVTSIVPAVPSDTGVADVFAYRDNYPNFGIQAVTSEGATAWNANVSYPNHIFPDFQGGLVVMRYDPNPPNALSILKLDGITGQAYPAYVPPTGSQLIGAGSFFGVHTDGTIFAVQINSCSTPPCTETVIGVNPTTGTQKFSVPIEGSDPCGMIVGGDGNAYVAYEHDEVTADGHASAHLTLLRVDSGGVYSKINVFDWLTDYRDVNLVNGLCHMVTNADQGALLSWESQEHPNPFPWEPHVAITTGTSVSLLGALKVPGQAGHIVPGVQAQDGSFVGRVGVGPDPVTVTQQNMIAFDGIGTLRWSVANDQPRIATDDGGVIGNSGITYDHSGNATGQALLFTQSWRGNLYEVGTVHRRAGLPAALAAGFWSFEEANASDNETAALRQPTRLVILKTGQTPADCYSSTGNSNPTTYAQRNITYIVKDQYDGYMYHMKYQERLQAASGSPCPIATTLQNGLCVGQSVPDSFQDQYSAFTGTGHSEYTQVFWVATPENTPNFATFFGQIPQIDAYQTSASSSNSLIETQFVIKVNENTGLKPDGTPIRRCN